MKNLITLISPNWTTLHLVDMLEIGLHSLPGRLPVPGPGVAGVWNPNGLFLVGRDRSKTSAVLSPVLPSKPP